MRGVKVEKFLSMLIVSLILLTNNLVAFAQTKSENLIIDPRAVEVCSVHGYAHRPEYGPGWSSTEKMALTKGGDVYNSSYYKCRCGSTIYWTNETPTYNYYWFIGKWHNGGIPGTGSAFSYIVPDSYYRTNAVEPPGWDFY